MKKVFLSMIAAALSFGAFAQDTTTTATPPPTEQQQQHQQKDMYVFKNSKMWEVKNGNVTQLAKDATLTNGTIVKTNGEITKDGQTVTLKEGQYIDVNGNIGETATEK